ncbi:MAG: restriction endonuclease subunit S, partial [Anaerolineae bacterium]|nr:restriction endonuclease subunit S [Anaerolineae bacterium]
MDTIQKHEKYKDSEVEWIGKIPYNWKVSRLKNAVDSCINGVWGDEPNGENDIVCIRVADFQRYNFTVSLKNNTLRHISENDFK